MGERFWEITLPPLAHTTPAVASSQEGPPAPRPAAPRNASFGPHRHRPLQLGVYARRARAACRGGRTGSVTVLQRAGGALNANLHCHTLVLDGMFTEAPGSALAFHPAPGPSDAEVAAALATIRHRVQRLLVRHGLEPGDDATGPADRLADESAVLAGIVLACPH
jgi:putative transposase